MTNTANHY